MKKRLVLTLAMVSLLSLGMASCGKTSVSSSTSTSTSTAPTYDAATVKLSVKDNTEVEVKTRLTIRATVTTDNTNKLCNFTFSDNADTYINIPDTVDGVASLAITGRAAGTVTITATSAINPTASASVTIKVIAAKPTLRNAWKKIVALTNYTITGATTEDSTSEVKNSVTKVTKTAVTETYDGNPLYTSTDKTSKFIGIAVGSDGYALYLQQNNSDGSFVTPATRVKTSQGFLGVTNFAGAGTSATSPNDVDMFFSYAAINPSWLSNTKTDDNIYTITGTDSDSIDSVFTECLLWKLLDPTGYAAKVETIATGNTYSLIDMSTAINTTIQVTGASDVVVTLTDPSDETKVVQGTISEVGTTAQAADVTTFLAGTTAVSSLPTLSGTLGDIKTTMDNYGKKNYVQINNVYLGETYGTVPYYGYYTEKYFFNFYTEDFATKYSAATSKSLTAGGSGYYLKDSGEIVAFTISAAGAVTVGDTATTIDTTKTSLSETLGYVGYTDIFQDDIYALGDTAEVVFTGYGNWYYCQSQEVAEDMMNYYWGETQSGDEYIAGINATYAADNTTVSEIDCLMAWGGSDGYYSLTTFGFKNFGTANNNDYNAAITAAFAA